jgi:AraC-like DNA-binding protein
MMTTNCDETIQTVTCIEFSPRLLDEFRGLVENSTPFRVASPSGQLPERGILVRQCLKRCLPMPGGALSVQSKTDDVQSLALISMSRSTSRSDVFSQGYSDYLFYPFVLGEVQRRLSSARALVAAREEVQTFSNDPLVEATCQYLADHPDFSSGIDNLAREIGSNRNTLTRRFKEAFGISPMAWFRKHRMTIAASLVMEGQRSIQEISYLVGYEDANNFSTAFRKFFEMSPREYRQKSD